MAELYSSVAAVDLESELIEEAPGEQRSLVRRGVLSLVAAGFVALGVVGLSGQCPLELSWMRSDAIVEKAETYNLLKATGFVKIPGYTGPLSIGGAVVVTPGVSGSSNEAITWTLTGADPACTSGKPEGGNCMISINTGTSCDAAGNSYFTGGDIDPYMSKIAYESNTFNMAYGTANEVYTGYTGQQLNGHAVLVRDSTATTIACAVLEPAPFQPPAGVCLPRDALARVERRGTLPLEDLAVGDPVLVQRESGSFAYEPLLGFLHITRSPATFLTATHASGEFRASANHVVFVDADGRRQSKLMSELRVGDFLLLAPEETNGPAALSPVLGVRGSVDTKGMLTPLTRSGSIVVDGAVTSIYATHSAKVAIPHCVLHAVFFPVRMLARFTEGRSASGPAAQDESYEATHPYVTFWLAHLLPLAKGLLSL